MEDKLKIVEAKLDKVITPYSSMKRSGNLISFIYKDINTLLSDKEDLIKRTKDLDIPDTDEIIKMIDEVYAEFIMNASKDKLEFPDIRGDALKVYNSLNVINTCNYLLAKYKEENILTSSNYAHLNNILDTEFNDIDRLLSQGKASKYYMTGSKVKIRLVKALKAASSYDKIIYNKYMLLSNEEYSQDEEDILSKLNPLFHEDIKRFYKKLRTINDYIKDIDSLNQHMKRLKIYEKEDHLEEIKALYDETKDLFDTSFLDLDLINSNLDKLNNLLMKISSHNLKEKLGSYVKDLNFCYIENNTFNIKSNKLLDKECNNIIDLITKDINTSNISLSEGMNMINYLVKYFIKVKDLIARVRSNDE